MENQRQYFYLVFSNFQDEGFSDAIIFRNEDGEAKGICTPEMFSEDEIEEYADMISEISGRPVTKGFKVVDGCDLAYIVRKVDFDFEKKMKETFGVGHDQLLEYFGKESSNEHKIICDLIDSISRHII